MKHTTNPEGAAILISKKAYADFAARIRQTLSEVELHPESIESAIRLLDRYVRGEIIDLENADTFVKLAIFMLKPEIDKAMRRSLAARERARLRREKTASDFSMAENTAPISSATSEMPEMPEIQVSSGCSENSEPPANISTAERPMNRRERREYEQELVREQRRWERHLKRMRSQR